MEFLGADVVLVARGDGSRRYCGRGGADGSRRLGEGARGLARGPHFIDCSEETPLLRGVSLLLLPPAAEVKPSSYDAARRGRQVRRDAQSLLKREEEKCVLPGRAAARARLLYQNLPIEGLASGRSRRRVLGRRARLPGYLPHARTAGGFWLLASVLHAARCRSSRVTFSGAALALHGEKIDESNSNVLYYSQRECCGRRNDAVIDF